MSPPSGSWRNPWALAGLLGVSVVIAIIGWVQVRDYEETQARFEAAVARIQAELPDPDGPGGSSPVAARSETASLPAEADEIVVVMRAGQEAGTQTIQIGEQSWTLPGATTSASPSLESVLKEVEVVVKRAVEERGVTKARIRHEEEGIPDDPGTSTVVVMALWDIFARVGVQLDVTFESPMPPAFVPEK